MSLPIPPRNIKKINLATLIFHCLQKCLQMDAPPSTRFTRREVFYLHNTLLCLVKALENRYTAIDLKNETTVTGKIAEVDGFMNVTVTDAGLYDTDGELQYFPMLHIQARNIRNVHIPDNVNITKTIKNQVMKEPKKPTKGKLTFKESRAKKRQKETLELIKKMKAEEKQGTSDTLKIDHPQSNKKQGKVKQ